MNTWGLKSDNLLVCHLSPLRNKLSFLFDHKNWYCSVVEKDRDYS